MQFDPELGPVEYTSYISHCFIAMNLQQLGYTSKNGALLCDKVAISYEDAAT